MKKFKLFALAIAVVAFVGMFACNSGVKKDVEKVVTEEVVDEKEPISEEMVVADSTVTEEAVTEEPAEVEAE